MDAPWLSDYRHLGGSVKPARRGTRNAIICRETAVGRPHDHQNGRPVRWPDYDRAEIATDGVFTRRLVFAVVGVTVLIVLRPASSGIGIMPVAIVLCDQPARDVGFRRLQSLAVSRIKWFCGASSFANYLLIAATYTPSSPG